jgi:hypothetical protein
MGGYQQPARLLSPNFLQRFPFGEFVYQFIEVADFLHGRFLDVFTRTPQITPVIRDRKGFI